MCSSDLYGGDGLSTWSTWGSVTGYGQNIGGTYWFGGGGAGWNNQNAVGGGDGGGANTAVNQSALGDTGMANTGGGGGTGGGNGAGYNGGAGGSGLVIFRTAGTYTAAATTGSPTRTVSGGYTYYAWTGNGSITI